MDLQKEREAFEKKFPVPAHWIDFCGLTCKYICKYNVIDDQTLKYQARWESWLAAKAQAVPEKDAVINKLSNQLYAQEMKTSAARVLCETACELLDDYAHQDAMVILNDLEQAMKEPAND